MINVLIPACGKSKFYEDNYYPQNVTEINGRTMIEHVIRNYASLKDAKYTVCLFQNECDSFHTDEIVNIVTNRKGNIVKQENTTAGALCTCLLAVDYINNDDPLIIANSDQIIKTDIEAVIKEFEKENADCGVISFHSVHPRWSYVRVDEDGNVIEAAEKHPISDHAIAGFYYFKKGKYFVDAAKRTIRKRETYEDKYFISASINEIILQNKKVSYFEIPSDCYKSFYSPDKIAAYLKEEGK